MDYLLYNFYFMYVLTAKLNQDCLKKSFGIIRQVAGPNDHPSIQYTLTFLQLYSMLSVYLPT
ncbi:Uncharacterized protein FWK35_00021423 [Aphis craccivora]|uniref:Transposable element P transposase-like RNase H C-terminal domain-containing protein n=1 Tax=Aphis craccivora TaxID=307492 RepID=A0A6G0YAN6_APHCR|nr:Uncharacterized protein FWK35_00021423 [Aphis craccivora]